MKSNKTNIMVAPIKIFFQRKICRRLLFLFLSSFSLMLYGQEITLKQCREMALENNKQMAIADQNIEKASLTVKAYRTNYLPKLSAQGIGYYSSSSNDMKLKLGEITLFDPNSLGGIIPPQYMPIISQFSVLDLPDMNFKLKTSNTYFAGASLEQPIYMGGKINSAYRMSKIGNDIAGLNRRLTQSEIILETDKAYWTCVQTRELHKSAMKYKEVVEEFYRVVKNACEAGMKSQNDLMKVQVQLNQAELQLRRAENAVRLSRMNLCHIIGLPLRSEITPLETFNGQVFEINPEADISLRPEYAMLDKQVELKEQEKRLVKSDFMPQIGVRGGYNYINGVKLNDDKLFDSGSFSAMVSVSVPLFHWGEGAKKIKAAEIEKSVIQFQRDDLTEKMTLEVEQSFNLYSETLLEVELTLHALKQSEENLKMSRDHYEAGMETISDYLEAQTIWQNAQSEHIMAKTKLEICKTEYLKATGGL
ncbi:MAG: TolC family protein [Bacteroidales bacterium]|jgi:outer membrane protein TolC|nr:TolC family protein [Bacteroidales bacterium]